MITEHLAKEFAENYLKTLKEKGLNNTFRSVRTIAEIMNISIDKVSRFVATATSYHFMCDDNMKLPNYIYAPTLYRVWENNL